MGNAGGCISLFVFFAAATLLPLSPARVAAGDAPELSARDEACFGCHDSPLAVTALGDGGTLPLFVERDAFAASLHAAIGCAGCHTDVDPGAHPSGRLIPSRTAYAAERSGVCRGCHPDQKAGEASVHSYLVRRTDTPACSVCHLPHRITSLRDWRAKVSGTRYCLSCHFRDIQVAFSPDETSIPAAGEAALSPAVHLDHECLDCHAGFSTQDHPLRRFASKRAHAERLAESCRRCHPDQYRLAEGSVHAAIAEKGDHRAPICTDCHGSHDVKPKAAFDILAGVPCRQCHRAVFETFGTSVHGQALARPGHTSAPLCSDCHRAHAVSSLGLRNQMNRACRGCHADIDKSHGRWLPAADVHLQSVSCPACHVPSASRGVNLRFFDSTRNQELSDEEVRRLLGADFSLQLDQIEEGDESPTIWATLRELNRAGALEGRTFVVQVAAPGGAEAHRLAGRGAALKTCGACHEDAAACIKKLCPVP